MADFKTHFLTYQHCNNLIHKDVKKIYKTLTLNGNIKPLVHNYKTFTILVGKIKKFDPINIMVIKNIKCCLFT